MSVIIAADLHLGLCECGCGHQTMPSRDTVRARGWVSGQPRRFLRGHNRRRPCTPEYLVNEVTNCWEWQHPLTAQGYARPNGPDRRIRSGVHILYWEQTNGPVPIGKELHHLCENRSCVNPAHLIPVTHLEHMQIGRTAKLSASDVRDVRAQRASGRRQADLAREYGVDPSTISNAVRHKTWANIGEAEA
jgi:hypothetical protein